MEQGLLGEFERWSTVSKQELDEARSELLEQRKQRLSDDFSVAMMLAKPGQLGRTMAWEEELDRKYAALTPEQVVAAVKKAVDPRRLVTVTAGDFEAPRSK